MRGVSKGFRHVVALLTLLSIVVAQGAVAAEPNGVRTLDLRDRLERAQRFVVTIFARLGLPPG